MSPRISGYMQEDSKGKRSQERLTSMFSTIASRYDLLNDLLSLGIQRLWRSALFCELKGQNFDMTVDLCSGSGALLSGLARHSGQILAVDICLAMMKEAPKRVAQAVLNKVLFVRADVHELPLASSSIDLLTVAFGVRNFIDLRKGLQEMQRVLKENGLLLVLELGQPQRGFLRLLYTIYSSFTLPLFGMLFAGNKDAYSYLHETACAFPCGDEFAEILERTGFKVEEVRVLSMGIAYLYRARRRGATH